VHPNFAKHLQVCREYRASCKRYTEEIASESAWVNWERVYKRFCGVPSRDEVVSPLLESTANQDLSDEECVGFGSGSDTDEAHTSTGDNLAPPNLNVVKIVACSEFLRQIRETKEGNTASDSDSNVSSSSEGDTFRLPNFLGGSGGDGQEDTYGAVGSCQQSYLGPDLEEEVYSPPSPLTEAGAHLREAKIFGPVAGYVEKLAQNDPTIGHILPEAVPEDFFNKRKAELPEFRSMLRLIDFCDQRNANGRKFLDDLLKLISDEMINNNFDPRTAPSRRKVTQYVYRNYAPGPEPLIGRFRCSGQENPYLISQDDKLAYRSRDVMNCIAFNVEHGIKDLLGDRAIFGNLNNLVVNRDTPSNPDRRFAPYVPVNGGDEVLDGEWRKETLKRMTKQGVKNPFNPHLEFMLDLILYYDKTGTTGNQRYPLEPFIFTLAIIRRQLRNNPRAWRPFGFMPDLETKSSADQQYSRSKNPGITQQTYHRFLEFILQGIQDVQDKGIVTYLRLGDRVKKVVLRINVAFIIQDGKSADMTTLRSGGNFYEVRRIARSCDCDRAKADNVGGKCKYTTLSDVEDDQKVVDKTPGQVAEMHRCSSRESAEIIESAKKSLKEKGFHPVQNAFARILFGLDRQHVFGASPVDLMHAFQSGIIMYLTKMILDRLTPKPKKQLDELVEVLLGNHKSSMSASYPKYNFTKGFSKVSNITSDEWVGKLFVLYMVSLTQAGQEILAKRFNGTEDLPLPTDFQHDSRQFAAEMSSMADVLNAEFVEAKSPEYKRRKVANKTVAGGEKEPDDAASIDSGGKKTLADDTEDVVQKCSYRDFQNLCESLLCFHSWYKIDSGTGFVMPAEHLRLLGPGERFQTLSTAMSKLMTLVKYYLPRKAGHRWKIQKFHDMLHIPWDMFRFGSPKNWDAGFLESSLRFWAKFPAQSAQNRGYNEFVGQVSKRLFEYLAMAKARRENGVVGVRDQHLVDLDDSCEVILSKEARESQFGGLPVLGGSSFLVNSRGGPTVIHPVVDNFLGKYRDNTSDEYRGIPPPRDGKWEVMSELKTVLADNAEGKRVLFRCHIDYRSTGRAWFDWAIVKFEGSPAESPPQGDSFNEPGCVPCKLLGFIAGNNTNRQPNSLSSALENIMVIVHACEFQSSLDNTASKVLSERHQLEYTNLTTNRTETLARPVLRIVRATSLISSCFAFEENPGLWETVNTTENPNYGRVHLLRPRQEWGTQFM
jgi:hypothetical protein